MPVESILTDERYQAVLDLVADGMSVKSACERLGFSRALFNRTVTAPDGAEPWPGKASTRGDRYAHARAAGWQAMSDDTASLSDAAIHAKDNVQVQGYRLAIDTRKWLLSKMLPKQYGDRLDVEHGGQVTLKVDGDDAAL